MAGEICKLKSAAPYTRALDFLWGCGRLHSGLTTNGYHISTFGNAWGGIAALAPAIDFKLTHERRVGAYWVLVFLLQSAIII